MTHPLPDKAVEAGARALFEALMSPFVITDEVWLAEVAHYNNMVMRDLGYAQSSAVIACAFRSAETCISAALAADGLVVVPREPTQAMLDAIVTYPAELVAARNDPAYTAQMQAATLAERALAAQRYRAMIEAAREG